jgi:hypothetical protein
MKTVIPFLFAMISVFQLNHTANADPLPPAGTNDERVAMQAAIGARNDFVRALINRDYVDLARAGFDQAIKDLADQLANEQGKPAEAQELMQKWGHDGGVSQFQMAFSYQTESLLSKDDLGDHAPLFAWLEQYLVKLENKYGSIITKLPIIANIRMVNFALPVVFTPGSSRWQLATQDNRIEYRKHFIPFANLVTYYGSLYACNVAVAKSQYPQLKKLCKKAAGKLEFVMGRYIAPHISDFIFKVSNRKKTKAPVFTRDQLRYENGDELARDIRMEVYP